MELASQAIKSHLPDAEKEKHRVSLPELSGEAVRILSSPVLYPPTWKGRSAAPGEDSRSLWELEYHLH